MSDFNLGGHGPPPPRGILKNTRTYSSSEIPSDPRLQGQGRYGELGLNPHPPPSGDPRGLLDNHSHSEYRRKLNDFVEVKKDMLYKPLNEDERPLSEVKGINQGSEDHYGVTPSLDHYLRVAPEDIRNYFFQNCQAGDILIAAVYSRNNSGLTLKLLTTDGGKHVVLEDLGIKAFCPASQMNEDYEPGDLVRVEVLDVFPDTEKITCGMRGNTLSPEMQHALHLGKISKSDLPKQFLIAKEEGKSRHRKDYEELLKSNVGFRNPTNIEHLASSMGIFSNKNSLMVGLREDVPITETASYLRRMQNAKWAHGSVADGIKFFKLGNFAESFQCLNKALSIDAENVEGLAARGALYANNGGYDKAIEDFEAALKHNPNHHNARKYLAETLTALGKQQEGQGKIEDAIASYSKCLVVKSDHQEAKDALLAMYERTKKLDNIKLSGAASLKAAELKDKLKVIIQGLGIEEDKGKKESKKKKKKSKGSSDSSSSSSSSESDSDSSSDESSSKKKRSKKKKKKSKKKKKKEVKKEKESSLSPFSQRLVGNSAGLASSGLAGFAGTASQDWKDQLGLNSRIEQKVGSEEKKRAKKKEKRKKRKRSSSSSSSSENESSDEREKRKKKSKVSVAGIADFGDLEAKLTSYYSKVEHEKLEQATLAPTSVKITVDRNSLENTRRIELQEPQFEPDIPVMGQWTETKLGRIQLKTDEYGNFIQPGGPQAFVRTVHNEPHTISTVPPHSELKPIKFEIKKPTVDAAEPATKWKPLGTTPTGESEERKHFSFVKNPFEVQKFDDEEKEKEKGKVTDKSVERERNFRGRRRSPSPPSKRRRAKSDSRSKSRSSHSRSRSSSSSRSRSRSKSRSPSRGRGRRRFDRRSRERDFGRMRRDYRGRGGGGNVRFFRGYNRRVTYTPRRGRHFRPNGPRDSKYRNRFNRSVSRSRSKSGSRSRSMSKSKSKSRSRSRSQRRERGPHDRKESKDKDVKSPTNVPDKRHSSPKDNFDEPLEIGGLTTSKAAEVEELLDKRNAEKKEEMRKSNPDFFRA